MIAGGRSQRFGGEKAVATLHGTSLLARACTRLAADCRVLAVNARKAGETAALAGELGVTIVEDEPGTPLGPLSGVLAGLRWARAEGAALLVTRPCDTPFLPDDLTRRLVEAAGARSCAVARTPDGVQSLCAAWRIDLADTLAAALSEGRHPAVRRFLETHGCAFVDYPDADAFLNINTRQDLAEAERRAGDASTARA